jgi:tetratricopeptide (TPR) repeat protein
MRALIAVALGAVAALAQDAQTDFHARMEKAAASGDAAVALEWYRSAERLARDADMKEEAADAALHAGQKAESLSRYLDAIQWYGDAADAGTPPQRQVALSNMGVLYLNQGKVTEALDSFGRIDFQAADPATAPRLRFNYGSALEQAGQKEQAYRQIRTAAEMDPSLRSAVEKAVRDLAPSAGEAIALCGTILQKAGAPASKECIHRTLERWAGDSDAGALLALLIRLYVGTGENANAFANSEEAALPWSTASPRLRAAMEQIRAAFAPWTRQCFCVDPAGEIGLLKAAGYSALLVMTAEQDRDAGAGREALWRYAGAWSIDQDNLDAALGFVSLWNQDPPEEDARAVFEPLLKGLFPAGQPATGKPYNQLFRLHMELAAALERGHGCESRDGESDPRAALFHWRRAEKVENLLRFMYPKIPYSYELYKHLARCYRRDQHEHNAYLYYLDREREGFRAFRSLYGFAENAKYHLESIYYWPALLRVGAQAGVDQWRGSPPRWRQGAAGYGIRYASAEATRAVREGLALGIDTALREDPHFVRLGIGGVRARIVSVLRQTVVCYDGNGNYTFAFWRVGSAYGSALIADTWRPVGSNGVADGMVHGSLALVIDTGSDALQEFMPDLKRVKGLSWAGRLVESLLRR